MDIMALSAPSTSVSLRMVKDTARTMRLFLSRRALTIVCTRQSVLRINNDPDSEIGAIKNKEAFPLSENQAIVASCEGLVLSMDSKFRIWLRDCLQILSDQYDLGRA